MPRETKGRLFIIASLILAMFGASMAGVSVALAQVGPPTAAATQPAAPQLPALAGLDLDTISDLVVKFISASKGKCWPAAIGLLACIVLWLIRTIRPLLGESSTKWLTSRGGILAMSLITGIGTAFSNAVAGGFTWEALGMAAISGLMIGLLNAGLLHSVKTAES